MGRETVLFKTEEKMSRAAAADLLRRIADRLDSGEVVLQQGEAKTRLKIPERVEMEIKAEKEVGRKKKKKKLELEIEWIVGGKSADRGSFRLG